MKRPKPYKKRDKLDLMGTGVCNRCGRRILWARSLDHVRRMFDIDPAWVLPSDGLDLARPGYLPHYCRDRTDSVKAENGFHTRNDDRLA